MPATETSMQHSLTTGPGPAEVLEVDASGEFVRIHRQGSWNGLDHWARVAFAGPLQLEPGDQVLVTGEPDELYVIGCLNNRDQVTLRAERSRLKKVATAAGVYAECGVNSDGQETLRVLSPAHELLFEVNPSTGTTRLAVPQGSLELLASSGDLSLLAAGTVRISGRSVELTAQQRLALAVSHGLSTVGTWLRLFPQSLQAGGAAVEISASRSQIKVGSADISAEKVSIATEQYQLKASKVEILAERIIERAGNVYRTVRGLTQLQTGRLRTYVSGLSHFRSKTAYLSAEETIHINGDKVQLG